MTNIAAAEGAPRGLSDRVGLAVVAVVGLAMLAAVFGPHLGGDFVWDDRTFLLESARVRSPDGWRALLTEPFALGGSAYRPFSTITLWLEWQLFGPSIAALRIGNLALHLATGVLLFAWMRKLGVRSALAVVLALVMLAHPLSTEPVMFANARHDLLGSVCALGALVAWPRAGAKTWAFVGASALGLLALASKESFVIVPALLALEALRTREKGTPLPRALAPIALPLVLVVAFFAVRATLAIPSSSDQLSAGIGANLVHFGGIVLHYGSLVLTGRNGLSVERYISETPLLAGGVLVFVGVLLLLLGQRARGGPSAAAALLGLAVFLLALAPDVLAVPLLGQYANRYAYFPMLGLFAFAGAALEPVLPESDPFLARLVLGAGAAAALLLALSTSFEASAWVDARTLFGRDLSRRPEDSRALYHVGVAVMRDSGCAEALPFFERSTVFEPAYARAWHNVSGCLVDLRRFSEAVAASQRELALTPGNPGALYNLGVSLVSLGRRDEGIEALERALAASPSDAATQGALEAARRLR